MEKNSNIQLFSFLNARIKVISKSCNVNEKKNLTQENFFSAYAKSSRVSSYSNCNVCINNMSQYSIILHQILAKKHFNFREDLFFGVHLISATELHNLH